MSQHQLATRNVRRLPRHAAGNAAWGTRPSEPERTAPTYAAS